ncbi:MAG: hypothetical protein ACSLE6_13855 [Mycobacterium sp.]
MDERTARTSTSGGRAASVKIACDEISGQDHEHEDTEQNQRDERGAKTRHQLTAVVDVRRAVPLRRRRRRVRSKGMRGHQFAVPNSTINKTPSEINHKSHV